MPFANEACLALGPPATTNHNSINRGALHNPAFRGRTSFGRTNRLEVVGQQLLGLDRCVSGVGRQRYTLGEDRNQKQSYPQTSALHVVFSVVCVPVRTS